MAVVTDGYPSLEGVDSGGWGIRASFPEGDRTWPVPEDFAKAVVSCGLGEGVTSFVDCDGVRADISGAREIEAVRMASASAREALEPCAHRPEWDSVSHELRSMGYTMLANAMDQALPDEEHDVARLVLLNVRQIIAQHGESVTLEPLYARLARL